MTLTMQQIISLLRNAIKDFDFRDSKLMYEILIRSINDQPILQLQEEVVDVIWFANSFFELWDRLHGTMNDSKN